MEKQTLFWLFIIIFAITAIITLLGITGVIKNIKDRYLNTLFTALILEVVAAVFLIFQGFNFNESTVDLGEMITKSGLNPPVKSENHKSFIIEKLALTLKLDKLTAANDKLKTELTQKTEEINKIKGDINQFDQSFYSNIIKLDNAIDHYIGQSINIGFEPEKKEEVYRLLVEVFSDLGKIRDGDAVYLEDKTVNKPLIRKIYSELRTSYGREVLEDTQVYIDEFDVSQLVKFNLEKK